jgi:hypothetical protein
VPSPPPRAPPTNPAQVILTRALFQLASDHPYHSLYPLIALKHGDTEGGDKGAAPRHDVHVKHHADRSKVRRCWQLGCASWHPCG